jgi:general secretion pathway protein L
VAALLTGGRDGVLARALARWGAELGALLPASARRWLGLDPDVVVIDATATGIDVGIDRAGRFTAIGQLAKPGADAAVERATFAGMVARAGGDPERITLRIAPGQALGKTIELPLAAEENLRQVLAYEMERQTPFRADQVRFTYAVVGRDTAARRLTIALTVVPNEVIERQLGDLERVGVGPAAIVVGEPGTPLVRNADATVRSGPMPRYRRADRWLAAAALVLALILVALPLVRHQLAAARFDERIAQVRAPAEAALKLAAELDAELAGAGTVSRIKAQAASPVLLIEELARLLPDDTWLVQFTLSESELEIEGLSLAAAALVAKLEAAPLFANVRFRTPVTRDPLTGREHFALMLTVARP